MLDRFYDSVGHIYYIYDEDMTPDVIQAVLNFLKDRTEWRLQHCDDYASDDPEDDTMEHYFALYNHEEWD